jgi:phospholipase/lecithinase/hemolysin
MVFIIIPPVNLVLWLTERSATATDRSPLMLQNAVPLSAAIEDFNGKLATQLEVFKAAHNGTRAVLVDTHVPFLEALDNPQEYGSPDDTCFNGDGVSCVSDTTAQERT